MYGTFHPESSQQSRSSAEHQLTSTQTQDADTSAPGASQSPAQSVNQRNAKTMHENTRPIRGFKRKTIEQTIKRKMNNWLKSIEDEKLREDVRRSYIVTGGAIASMLLGELPNDFDVYFSDADVATRLVNHYLKDMVKTEKISQIHAENLKNRVRIKIKSAGIMTDDTEVDEYQYFEMLTAAEINKYFEEKDKKAVKYKPAVISSNAISLHGDVQLIFRFVGDPNEIHKNYDFAHCTNWYTEKDGLVLQLPAVEAVLCRELKYVGSLYPICSLFRIRKFLKRGFTITAGELLKISWDINELNLQDPVVLQEQLIGVDMAYWLQILSIMKEDVKNGRELDRTYVFECINRVFDEVEEHPDVLSDSAE